MARRFYNAGRIAATCIFILAAAAGAGAAEDEFLASLRLRGGHDGNPRLLAAPHGSPLAGLDAVALFGRKADGQALALAAEASFTRYRDAAVDPVQRYKFSAAAESRGRGGVSLRSISSAGYFSNYEARLFEAEQTLRLGRAEGAVRPFVMASLRHLALNEVSPVLGEFLPRSHRLLRGTIIPGVAFHQGDFEIGASLNLSATRYAERLDLFGYRRDNERIQPFVFARYAGGKLTASASLSQLYGDWHDADFSDVRRTLFEVSLGYKDEPFELEFSAARFATETTFPVSPISIDTEVSARLTAHPDPSTRVAAFGRTLEREFLDSPFRSRQTSYGIELARDVAENLTLAAELAHVRMRPIAGGPVAAVVVTLSMTRRYGAGPESRLRAGTRFPPARPSR